MTETELWKIKHSEVSYQVRMSSLTNRTIHKDLFLILSTVVVQAFSTLTRFNIGFILDFK